jgi:AcrR family transcriptional regulator
VYSFWHGHLSALLAAERPDVDAGLTAHLILGALHSEPVLERLAGDSADVAAALRAMVQALLDAG